MPNRNKYLSAKARKRKDESKRSTENSIRKTEKEKEKKKEEIRIRTESSSNEHLDERPEEAEDGVGVAVADLLGVYVEVELLREVLNRDVEVPYLII